jgi:glycosyltransferase involved in cell wall biosynthesis
MRFLMLNWRDPKNPISGGAERVSLAYLSELVRRGHEVFWFANGFPGGAREELVDGIRFIRGGGKGTSILQAVKWYRHQPRFDLVIDQQHGLPWYAPWWCGTNCVAYIHEVLGPIWKSFYPWPISSIGMLQERWTLRRYRNIPFWTPSNSTREVLTAFGVREIKVIPNGCDTESLPKLESKLLQTPLKLVVVSRLAPNKRVDHAIRLVEVLQQRQVNTKLTIVGRGDSEQSLRELVTSLKLSDRVHFTGALPELEKNRHLRQANFLIHTSVREGWGLNVVEANAMGTPAAVYPVGGLVDSTVDGVTGLIAKEESPEALAEQLISVLKSPQRYEPIRVNAWERSKEFSWERILPSAAVWLENQAMRSLPHR